MWITLLLSTLLFPAQAQGPRPPFVPLRQAPIPPQAPPIPQEVGVEEVSTDAQKYARAYRECRESGKPLVVWIGGNLCPD